MKTICTNLECLQDYHIKPEALGKLVRCKRCNTIFKIEELQEPVNTSDLFLEEDETEAANVEAECLSSEATRTIKRKSTKEIIQEKIKGIRIATTEIIPSLKNSYDKGENESDTRLLIDLTLTKVLGYQIDNDIKTEQKINGKKADYVLSVNGEDCIILEAKAIRSPLKENHIYQATAYGAYAGIKWVVLTNGLVWMLYRVSTGEKLAHDLIFTINLLDGLDEEEAEHFYLISKDGMSRKHLLEKAWQKIWALNPENLTDALLSEDVISKVRVALTKQTGYKVTNEELRRVLMSRTLFG